MQLAGEFCLHSAWLGRFAAATHGVTGGFEDSDGLIKRAAIQGEGVVVLVEADDETGRLESGEALGLADVELWVGDRAEVAKCSGRGAVDAFE